MTVSVTVAAPAPVVPPKVVTIKMSTEDAIELRRALKGLDSAQRPWLRELRVAFDTHELIV